MNLLHKDLSIYTFCFLSITYYLFSISPKLIGDWLDAPPVGVPVPVVVGCHQGVHGPEEGVLDQSEVSLRSRDQPPPITAHLAAGHAAVAPHLAVELVQLLQVRGVLTLTHR